LEGKSFIGGGGDAEKKVGTTVFDRSASRKTRIAEQRGAELNRRKSMEQVSLTRDVKRVTVY